MEGASGSSPKIVKKKKGGELWSPLEFIIKAKLLLFTPQSLCNVGAKLCLFSITAAERKTSTGLSGSPGSLDASFPT